ncbi:hypothetical protein HDU93_002563, partial [Gonapodya sp. JEL0774]
SGLIAAVDPVTRPLRPILKSSTTLQSRAAARIRLEAELVQLSATAKSHLVRQTRNWHLPSAAHPPILWGRRYANVQEPKGANINLGNARAAIRMIMVREPARRVRFVGLDE